MYDAMKNAISTICTAAVVVAELAALFMLYASLAGPTVAVAAFAVKLAAGVWICLEIARAGR